MSRRYLALLAAWSLATPATAGDIRCSMGVECHMPPLAWHPTGCERPAAPDIVAGRSVNAYNAAVDRHNAYLNALKEYVDCVAAEAEHDMSAFQARVIEDAKAIQEQAAREAGQAKIKLDLARPQ